MGHSQQDEQRADMEGGTNHTELARVRPDLKGLRTRKNQSASRSRRTVMAVLFQTGGRQFALDNKGSISNMPVNELACIFCSKRVVCGQLEKGDVHAKTFTCSRRYGLACA